MGFYGLGWGFHLVALARCFRRVRRLLRACISLEDIATGVQLSEVARRMGVSPLPRLLEIEGGAPFLSGTLRPAIVLPRALLAAPKSDLEAVLAHELAHLKRRDLVWNALLWFVQTLLWFHPLVWAARRFLSLETEGACDEMVLTATRITPQSYGALLLNTMNTPQTPVTAGVADGFFALKTRLVRLNRTPQRPHRAFRVAFAAALCLAFGALVPLRFVARAQSEAPLSPTVSLVSGTVVDQAEKPVAGATVYAMGMMRSGAEPLETAVSDDKGGFAFSPKVRGKWGVSVFADAGPRGMGEGEVYLHGERKSKPVTVRLAPVVRAKLRFLDPQGRPAANLEVRLRRVGQSQSQWLAMPRAVLARMKATTNARGEADFPPLPVGNLAQFQLSDETSKHTKYGSGDRRGVRFAPLSTEDFVLLRAPQTSQTVRLLSPVRVVGRATLDEGDFALSPSNQTAMPLSGPR